MLAFYFALKRVGTYNYTFNFYPFKKHTFKSVIFKSPHKWFLDHAKAKASEKKFYFYTFDFYSFKNYTFESVVVSAHTQSLDHILSHKNKSMQREHFSFLEILFYWWDEGIFFGG